MELDKLHKQGRGLRWWHLFETDGLAISVEHLLCVNIDIQGTFLARKNFSSNDSDFRVGIYLALSQTANGAGKVGDGMALVVGKEYTAFVVSAVTKFAFNLVNGIQDGHPASADTPRAICPVIVNILAEGETRPSSFLRASDCRSTSQDAMQTRQVEAKGDVRIGRNCELNLV
jgi:hypothetical protein